MLKVKVDIKLENRDINRKVGDNPETSHWFYTVETRGGIMSDSKKIAKIHYWHNGLGFERTEIMFKDFIIATADNTGFGFGKTERLKNMNPEYKDKICSQIVHNVNKLLENLAA